jgi:hypothetical protein
VMGWRYVHCKALYLIHKFMKDLTCWISTWLIVTLIITPPQMNQLPIVWHNQLITSSAPRPIFLSVARRHW